MMKSFWREWRDGYLILRSVLLIGGLSLIAGGIFGAMAVSFLVAIPLELITGKTLHEDVLLVAALVGAATFGISGLGRCKRILIDAMEVHQSKSLP